MDNSQPKKSDNFIFKNTGSSKCSNTYGDRIGIVRIVKKFESPIVKSILNRRFYSTGSTFNVEHKFKSFVERVTKNPNEVVDRKVYCFVCDVNFLNIAYNNIKSNFGNMTSGVIPEMLNDILYDVLINISKSLLDESFQFRSDRRIIVPKSVNESRSLTISFFRDKIVQEAIRIILNAVFEPTFLETSHGFRPRKSCHSALKMIKHRFKPVTWIIKGNISKCFDTIDHNILINLIENKILDRQFTKLIAKSLKAGCLKTKVIFHNFVDTPQGSIISPILCNIFMHQLDVFIKNLKKEFDYGIRARNLVKYENIKYKIKEAKRVKDIIKLKKLYKESQKHPVIDFYDPNYRRLVYVRYVDDWIVGIRGSYKETQNVLQKIKVFCSNTMKLNVNETKIYIANLNKNKVMFLGTNIFRSKHIKFSTKNCSFQQRQNLQLLMHVNLDRIKSKLSKINMLLGNKPMPKFLWLPLTHDQIIYLYNSILRRFLNFYSFVDNYSRFVSWIRWVIYSSAAKLLARKYNLSVTKVFQKFGPHLSSGIFSLYDPKYITPNPKFKISVKPVIPNLFAKFKSIAILYNLQCFICGSSYKVEMDQVRMMKDFNSKISAVDRLMIRVNKKQIPLCRKCHILYHRNKIKI